MIQNTCPTNQKVDVLATLSASFSGMPKNKTKDTMVKRAKPTRAANPPRRIKRDDDMGNRSFRDYDWLCRSPPACKRLLRLASPAGPAGRRYAQRALDTRATSSSRREGGGGPAWPPSWRMRQTCAAITP